MLNLSLLGAVAKVGRRLAEAGREARAASTSAVGPAADQVTEVIGSAVGEVVRAAVVGALAAAVHGSAPYRRPPGFPPCGPWEDEETTPPGAGSDDTPGTPGRPAWARVTRAAGAALSVAAGAAAAVPGGRVVAAGLGGLAAVAGLAARTADPAE